MYSPIKKIAKPKVIKIAAVCLATTLALGAFPLAALAEDGNTTTEVVLTLDESTLSITAPTTLSLSLDSAGTITAPDNFSIVNNCALPIAISAYDIDMKVTGSNPVSEANYASATAANSWYLTVQANDYDYDYDFTTDSSLLYAEWNIPSNANDTHSITLAFEGAMKNFDGNLTFQNGKTLSTVEWTFSPTLNSIHASAPKL